VKTGYFYPQNDYKKAIKDLTGNIQRNTLVAKIAIEDLKKQNEAILIAVDRVEMGDSIQAILKAHGVQSHFLHGTVSRDIRKGIVDDIKKGKAKILIATISLIGEGFDVDKLNSLLLASPVKYSGRVIQTVGRILRPAKGKTARVYDFRDDNVPILRRHALERVKIYREQWGADIC